MILRNRDITEQFIKEHLDKAEIIDNSTPSYSFAKSKSKEDNREVISRIFSITGDYKNNFDTAYLQASNGQGGESGNLLTLHSSALLPLLCFFNISAYNPLKIMLKGTLVTFDKVYFEVENIVKYDTDRNSSIDIALYSSDMNVILLLESKFTEPTNGGGLKDIAEKYVDRLSRLEDCGLRLKNRPNTFECKKWAIGTTNSRPRLPYYDGIKQMIAHLIGTETGPALELSSKAKPEKIEKQREYSELFINANRIFLGTILFIDSSFFDSTENEMIKKYMDLYEKSMQIISETITDPRIVLIAEPQTYQDVFKNQNPKFLLQNVAKFYSLE